MIEWASLTETLGTDQDRALADELAVVQQIVLGHRQLHQLLPTDADTPPHPMPDSQAAARELTWAARIESIRANPRRRAFW